MFVLTSDNKKIYTEYHIKDASFETIVLLNGLSQTTASWGFVVPHLKNKYNILLVDFIFQGNSDKEGNWRDFDEHAKDVISVLDFYSVSKGILIGLSYGSIVAQHAAVLFPNRISKLVLLSTFANKTPYYEAIELSWKRALEMGGYGLMLDVMLPYVLSDSYFSHPIIPIELLKSMRKDVVEAKSLEKLMTATLNMKDYRNELKNVLCPTCVIHGGKDLLFPVDLGKSVSDHIKDSEFHVLPNAGHTLNLEEVPSVVKLIEEFI
jgi:pimeloyl-ACP methyl ester carboxylesterase